MKTLLITGATGEIGKSIVQKQANKAIRLILASRSSSRLETMVKELGDCAADIVTTNLDFCDTASYEAVYQAANDGLDGLVLIPPKIAATQECMPSSEEWMQVFKDTFVAPLEFVKTVLPLLTKATRSKLVIISGISSKVLLSNYAANGAIRAAWNAQVKAMAYQYGQANIHVNLLSLGGVMTAAFKAKLHDESAKRGISEEALLLEKTDNVPLGKYASLSDVANAVDGLLGAFSDHMTGANIVCDGGFIRAY